MTNTTINIMRLEPIPFDNFANLEPLDEVNPILAFNHLNGAPLPMLW